jgi:hypothetical protein
MGSRRVCRRLEHGQELAQFLIGLGRDEAAAAAQLEGYLRSQITTPDVEAITADLDPYRIRLFVNEHDIVVRAIGG